MGPVVDTELRLLWRLRRWHLSDGASRPHDGATRRQRERRRPGLPPPQQQPSPRYPRDSDVDRRYRQGASAGVIAGPGYLTTSVPVMPARAWPGNVQTNG